MQAKECDVDGCREDYYKYYGKTMGHGFWLCKTHFSMTKRIVETIDGTLVIIDGGLN